MAASHYLNQCWLHFIGIHASSILQENVLDLQAKINIKNLYLKIFMYLPEENKLMARRIVKKICDSVTM